MSSRSGGRDDRVDALRGLALVVMFGAECAPPFGSFDSRALLQTLALPLFAVLIGVSAELGDGGARRVIQAFVRAGVRAAVLIGLGLWLDGVGVAQAAVLFALALPVLLAPLLARMGERALLVVGVALWAAGPWLMQALRPTVQDARTRGDELTVRLWDALCTGGQWRGTNILVWVCAGVVLCRVAQRAGGRRPGRGAAVLGAGLLAVAAVVWAARVDGRVPFAPHDGSRVEVFFGGAAAAGVIATILGLLPARAALPGLATPGSMSLSVWLVHVWFLRHFGSAMGTSGPWANVIALTVLALVLPVLWRSLVTRHPFDRGPIEGPSRLVTNVFR